MAHPDDTFVEGLRLRLSDVAATFPALAPTARPRWRRRNALAAAVAALLALSMLAVWIVRDDAEAVNASTLIDRAREAATAAEVEAPTQFVMTVRHTLWANVEQADGTFADRPLHRVELRRWVEQPAHWRSELWFFQFDPAGNPDGSELVQLFIGDGETSWRYNRGVTEHSPYDGTASINTSLNMGTLTERFGDDSIEAILQRASECRSPSLRGTELVGDRTAYVIDLGADRCAASAEQPQKAMVYAPATVWIDAETFLTLKWLGRSSSPNTWVVSEVTALDRDAAIDATVFEFVAPSPRP